MARVLGAAIWCLLCVAAIFLTLFLADLSLSGATVPAAVLFLVGVAWSQLLRAAPVRSVAYGVLAAVVLVWPLFTAVMVAIPDIHNSTPTGELLLATAVAMFQLEVLSYAPPLLLLSGAGLVGASVGQRLRGFLRVTPGAV